MNPIDVTALQPAPPSRAPERDGGGVAAVRGKPDRSEAVESKAAASSPQPPKASEMEALLERFERKNTSLSFQVDDSSGRTVILVRDSATSEVIKQIPSEDMLRVAQRLEAHLENLYDGAGLLLSDQI